MTDKNQIVIPASEVKTLTRSQVRKKNRLENKGSKKEDPNPGKPGEPGFFARTINFFTEAKEELMRVVWPTRKETIDSTWRLLVLVILAGIYLSLVDSVLSKLLSLLV